jgi:hypothetical protein
VHRNLAGDGIGGFATQALRVGKYGPMLRASKQAGIFMVPLPPCNDTSVFPVSPEGLPHLVASYYVQGDVEDLSSQVTHYDDDHTLKYCDSLIALKITIISCN